MTALVREGTRVTVPGLPGRWSVWSKAAKDDGPGAWFVIPLDPSPYSYAVVRVTDKRLAPGPGPDVALIRTEARRR